MIRYAIRFSESCQDCKGDARRYPPKRIIDDGIEEGIRFSYECKRGHYWTCWHSLPRSTR